MKLLARRCAIPLVLASAALSACSPSAVSGGLSLVSEHARSFVSAPLFTRSVDSLEAFTRFSTVGGDFFPGGRALKFFIDRREGRKDIYFINGNYTERGVVPDFAKYHYLFARRELGVPEDQGSFNEATYFGQEKRYVAGTVRSIVNEAGKVRFLIMFFPQDNIREEVLLETLATVKSAFRVPDGWLSFVPAGAQQTLNAVGGDVKELGFDVASIEEILGHTKYMALQKGEAYGYLRIFPSDPDALEPTDIPVFNELPLDLGVVAGVMTKAFQDVNSHVNLKSKERGTPNLVLRDAGPENPRLAPWADRPVRLVVSEEGFEIHPSTDQEVRAKYSEKMGSRPWRPIAWEPDSRLLSYDEMCPRNASDCLALGRRFGGKAANLGLLAHRSVLGRVSQPGTASARLGYDLSPRGFAIPLQFYKDFVEFPANESLRAKLADFVFQEKQGTLSKAERRKYVDEIQGLFLNARMPPAHKEAILARVAEAFAGYKKIKVRSSASAEDIPNFDGAGLHDSFSAKLDKQDNPDEGCRFEEESEDGVETKRKVKPATVACGIKGVYASLWNLRALEERNFAHIDPENLAMGISLLPAYDSESPVAANAVVVTRAINAPDSYGYSLSVQKGNNLVTNPLPGSWSETSLASFVDSASPMSFSISRHAKPSAAEGPLATMVLTQAQMTDMVRIAHQVEVAYCRAKGQRPAWRCGDIAFDLEKPFALDMEFKILENGHFVCKQVREFSGR